MSLSLKSPILHAFPVKVILYENTLIKNNHLLVKKKQIFTHKY